ncbi:MAG: DHA2 family efflux MFS transporter permease subunit [Burkholderiales bacterium]
MSAARHPLLITISVMTASFLYSLDWTIVAVALPHMQGTFSATQDQISWVITSYIVAAAITLPTAGWLATRFGRKRVYMYATTLFLVASVACGAATTLEVEIFARVVQGIGGAFLIPISHAIILDTYPPEEQGKAMSIWAIGSTGGSFVGPFVGGVITEYMNWRYCFYVNIPVGLLALLGTFIFVPETKRHDEHPMDWTGFLALALGIGSLQLMLDRGGRLDWFDSWEIVIEGCLAVLGFYLFLAHSLTYGKHPFLDLRIFRNRNFSIGLIYSAGYGLVTTPLVVLMPAFLQDMRGYPIDTIGFLQAPRGLGMLLAMALGGRLLGKVDARLQMAVGLILLAVSDMEMARWTPEVGAWPLVWTNFLQGIGGGIMLVPNQAIAFASLDPQRRTDGAALFNLVRSVAASVGISAAIAYFLRTSGASRAHMTEHITPFSEALQHGATASIWDINTPEGLAAIAREIDMQAAMLGYMGDFRMFAVAALIGLPLLFFVARDADTARKAKPLDVHFE